MLRILTSLSGAVTKAIAVSSLLIATACSPPATTKNDTVAAASSLSDKSPRTAPNNVAEMDHSGMNHGDHGSMSGMDHGNMTSPATTMAKLIVPSNIRSQTSIPLVINIQGADGKPIDKFDTFQEKLMHLIIVSDNLQSFSHIHPTYKQNGRFEVAANFPGGGSYTLVSDYQPAGQKEQVSIMKTKVTGSPQAAAKINFSTSKIMGDVQATLKPMPAILKAGEEVSLSFNLQQKNGQPLTGLQPYLGEKGHLVIMKQSVPLTRADYIHAHAIKGGQESEIVFMTKFPQPGKYKMWGQFNHNGKIVVADFWVKVSS
jgi:hypothetical protein